MGEGRVLVFVTASYKNKKITPQIDEVITALKLETSTQILNRLDRSQQITLPSDGSPT